jgi:hypothetical protein
MRSLSCQGYLTGQAVRSTGSRKADDQPPWLC